jgi:hypothetical protein
VAYVLKWALFAFRGQSWRVACPPGPKTKELPHLPQQLLALKLYRLYRSAQKNKIAHILAIWYDFEGTKQLHLRLKPKHMRAACRDTLDTKETRGVKKS